MKNLLIFTTSLISLVLLFAFVINNEGNEQPSQTNDQQETVLGEEELTPQDYQPQRREGECTQEIEDIVIENPQEECMYIGMRYGYESPAVIVRNQCDKPFVIDGEEYDDTSVTIDLEIGEYEMEGEIGDEVIYLSGNVLECL